MGELRSSSTACHLDLNNFEASGAERRRYVESCVQLGVKPVQVLIKSLNKLIAEQHDASFGVMRVMHESYEKERSRHLQMYHEEPERIIQVAESRRSDCKSASELEGLPGKKTKDQSSDRQTGPILYADLCLKGKSGSRSTLADKRDPDRSTVSSFSLGDFRHSPATEIKLQELTKEINKKMCVTIPERDRKIAALMLVKHQVEQDRLKLSQQEDQRRQEARRLEEAQQAQAEKKQRRKLKQSMRSWNRELEARRRLREHKEELKAGQLEQEVLLQEDHWRRLKEEVEAQRRQKMEVAQKEAEERKHYQERVLRKKEEVEKKLRERERQVAVEKEERARRSKVMLEKHERKRLQEENRRELLRHILLKKQVEQQVKEEEEHMRSNFERKLQHSSEKRAQAVEARLRELQERSAQEEEQIQRAQLKAKLQSIQQLTHKQILVQLSQRRMERASLHTTAQHKNTAQQTRLHNKRRQICHQRLKEKIQREEEAMMKVRENYISMKEWKRERLRKQREQIQEEAQRLARASYHMREKVRQQTHTRTFDQMALEAQLTASINRLKL
ncbi:coiled-coil domain-containing protein 177 [Melanotaenia boesemani]|uniref:coiled-coil domain-containing protein 177 n=1 Tax=Melanotaenia boesemani TaxID=1250792 RepID=UPI001C049C61|nr:coiled-coil domain-containing protein 177 [Melanotaenia boesemani]